MFDGAADSLWDVTAALSIISGQSQPQECFDSSASSPLTKALEATCGAYDGGDANAKQFTFRAEGNPSVRRLQTRKLDCTQGCAVRFSLKFGSEETRSAGCIPMNKFTGVKLYSLGEPQTGFPNRWQPVNAYDAATGAGAWRDGLVSDTVYGQQVAFRFQQQGSMFGQDESLWSLANVCILVGGKDYGCSCSSSSSTSGGLRTCYPSDLQAISGTACSCGGEKCDVDGYCWEGANPVCKDAEKVVDCDVDNFEPLSTKCSCQGTDQEENDCSAGQYCVDGRTCQDIPLRGYTDCNASNTESLTSDCRCDTSPGNFQNECGASKFCRVDRTCSDTPLVPFSYCGEPVDLTTMPDKTLLFYEHDNGGNNLNQVVIDVPDIATTVMEGGSMIFGGPSADYKNGALYLFIRTPFGDASGEDNVMLKRLWWKTGLTEVLFSEPASSFPFLGQAPMQLPAAFSPKDNTWYWFMKHNSVRGRIYKLDLSGFSGGHPLTLADATIVFEDPSNPDPNVLVEGALYFVQMRVDCDGNLWFNEGGHRLTKYTNLNQADVSQGQTADRHIVIGKDWLEDNKNAQSTRCKKSDFSCRIEGFAIDTTVAHSDTTKIWWTYDNAYGGTPGTDSIYNSIWTINAKVNTDKIPSNPTEVYKKVLYELQEDGQRLGPIEIEPMSQTLFVVTYFQNSGGRSIFRLPMQYPTSNNVGSSKAWACEKCANFYGYSWTAPYRAIGDFVVGTREAACTSVFGNTQIKCGAKQLALTTNCACNINHWRYPAAGSTQIIVVPGRSVSPVRNGKCPADSAVMRSVSEIEAVDGLARRGSCASRLSAGAPAGSGRYVFYTQDKPFGSLRKVTFGINLVQDDERLPKRHSVGGTSNVRVWPKDVRIATAQKSILGPVVDRATRELFYFRSNDCDLTGVCGIWDLVSLSFTTGQETVLYSNKPWEFPSSSALLTGTFAGRSVLAYDEATRTIFFTAVPRNSVKELKLFSLHLGTEPTNPLVNPNLARLAAGSELKHCQIRLRHMWTSPDHGAYNAMSANCDGTLHLAVNSKLWLFDTKDDTMVDITPASMSGKSIRAVSTSRPDAGDATKKWIYFATSTEIFRAAPNGVQPLNDADVEQLYTGSDATAPSIDCDNCAINYISTITVDPFEDAVYVYGDVAKLRNTKGGDRGIARFRFRKGQGAVYLVGGSRGDGVWRPTRYPATGSNAAPVVYLTAEEAVVLGQCPPAPTEPVLERSSVVTSVCDTFNTGRPDMSASSLWDLATVDEAVSGFQIDQCFGEAAPPSKTLGVPSVGSSGAFELVKGGSVRQRSLGTKPVDCASGGCVFKFKTKGSDNSVVLKSGDTLLDATKTPSGSDGWTQWESSSVTGSSTVFRIEQSGTFFREGGKIFAIADVCIDKGGAGCDAACSFVPKPSKPTPCVESDRTALTEACSCSPLSSSNECAAGKFCYDTTCNNAAKSYPLPAECASDEDCSGAARGSCTGDPKKCSCETGAVGDRCAFCDDGYYSDTSVGGRCVAKADPGQPCTIGDACKSGKCSGGFCCVEGCAMLSTTACAKDSGSCTCMEGYANAQTCADCDDTFVRKESGICVQRGSFGTKCIVAEDCLSSNCVDNTCCVESACGANRECSSGSCACKEGYAGENCDACASNWWMNASTSCLPTKRLGQACEQDMECDRDAAGCTDGFCCAQASCGSANAAGTCAPPTKAVGDNDGASPQVSTGECRCNEGYGGSARCDVCETGWYTSGTGKCLKSGAQGDGCGGVDDARCGESLTCVDGRCCVAASCSGHGSCDGTTETLTYDKSTFKYERKTIGTGMCECNEGWAGSTCDGPVLKVTSPTSDMIWLKNSTVEITWEARGQVASGTVKIRLYQNSGKSYRGDIVSSVQASAGRIQWQVPASMNTGVSTVRIISNKSPSVQVESAAFWLRRSLADFPTLYVIGPEPDSVFEKSMLSGVVKATITKAAQESTGRTSSILQNSCVSSNAATKLESGLYYRGKWIGCLKKADVDGCGSLTDEAPVCTGTLKTNTNSVYMPGNQDGCSVLNGAPGYKCSYYGDGYEVCALTKAPISGAITCTHDDNCTSFSDPAFCYESKCVIRSCR